MKSLRYFIEIAYKGSSYHGWQRQPKSISVQEVVEKALSTLLRKDIAIVGAGRTDAGVHAIQIYAHFDFEEKWDSTQCAQLSFKLNRFLPQSIAVKDILPVKEDAHARFDATSRSYIYRLSREKNPFNSDQAYQVQYPLDVDAMNKAAERLIGRKDFQCFSRSNTDVKTYICDVSEAAWKEHNQELVFRITADRFLRNMVRAVVGTLLEIGKGKYNPEHIDKVIQSKDRGEAGFSVPAHGLYLISVTYPKEIFIVNGR
tara:strand:- start:1403 stop:2176 length:774 start_codon:yes stop_codon:yes gene_type:complete